MKPKRSIEGHQPKISGGANPKPPTGLSSVVGPYGRSEKVGETHKEVIFKHADGTYDVKVYSAANNLFLFGSNQHYEKRSEAKRMIDAYNAAVVNGTVARHGL